MANVKTVYVVTDEVGTEQFTQLAKAAKFAGIKGKVTKAEVEAGKYPMITLEDMPEDMAYEASQTGDTEPTEPPHIEEPAKENAQRGAKESALQAIEEAMNAVDDSIHPDLFDRLCDLEDTINAGAELTDEQATLMTQVLTNTYMDSDDTQDSQEGDSDKGESDTPKAPKADVEYPEVGDFKDEKAMKKFIKGLSDESLQEWCILEGAEWKANDHQSINRMRMAMAIKAIHFPDTAPKKSKKSKSKYSAYTTEDLVQMALDNDVEVPDDKGDMRICRMYTIMALKKAGIIE